MEGRVQQLEDRVGEIIRRSTLLDHELIQKLHTEGPQPTSRTPLVRLSVPFFSETINTPPTVPYTSHGTVVDFVLQEGYYNAIPRTLLDAGLQRLHPRADVTPELSNYLYVIPS